jgi:phosphoglycerate dehydrogenase-like enzyme
MAFRKRLGLSSPRLQSGRLPDNHAAMPTNVLIIAPDPDAYTTRLQPVFPEVSFDTVRSLEVTPALDLFPDADAVLAYGRAFDRTCLLCAKRLKWFQCLITGTDHLAPVLAGSGVVLTNARGIHGPQMAELAVLHMLALSRNLAQSVRNQDRHVWERYKPRVLDHRTVAIVGIGAIAEHTAKVCKAFGMTTVGVTKTPREIAGFDRIYPRERLLQAAAEADFLLVLLPYNAQNAKAINEDVLRAMKPTACLINVARGGVVDEAALLKALDEGWIAGAGLDVFVESPLLASSPFWDRKNVFITPFVGGQSDQYEQNIMGIIEPNMRAFLAGRYDDMINRVPLPKG